MVCNETESYQWKINSVHIMGNILYDVLVYLYPTHAFNSPDSLVAEPASVTLVQAFLKGCLQLLGAGDDRPNTLAGLLSLQKGQSVPTSDGSVVKHHTWEREGWERNTLGPKEGKKSHFMFKLNLRCSVISSLSIFSRCRLWSFIHSLNICKSFIGCPVVM